MQQYCPECGKIHETMTAGCPYKKPINYFGDYFGPPNDVVLKNPIEEKLNTIINLLEKIEQHLRK